MQSKESSRLDQRRYAEVSALVQVGSPQIPGYGGMAAPKPGYGFGPENYVPDVGGNGGNGNGNGAGPGPFDPRGAFQVPNNFWGFVMLMMGLK